MSGTSNRAGRASAALPARSALLNARQIDGGVFSTTINLELEFEPITLVQRRHAGALHRADMDKRIGLAIVTLNKAKALHRVEEFDRARCLFAGELTGRPGAAGGGFARRAFLHGKRLALDLQIGCGNAPAAIDQRKPEWLPFGQAGQPRLLNRADVHKHILATIVAHDKAKALLRVEEFYDARAFANDLRGHAASAAATAATKTAAAAAEPVTAATKAIPTTEAVTAAETITTAEPVAAKAIATAEAVTAAKAAVKAAIAKPVALVPAAPAAIAAAPLIETHALFVFPVRPK